MVSGWGFFGSTVVQQTFHVFTELSATSRVWYIFCTLNYIDLWYYSKSFTSPNFLYLHIFFLQYAL